MRDDLRERLNTEVTRKQFLQFSAGALLMVFGLDNFIKLLTGGNHSKLHLPAAESATTDGFGARKFGE